VELPELFHRPPARRARSIPSATHDLFRRVAEQTVRQQRVAVGGDDNQIAPEFPGRFKNLEFGLTAPHDDAGAVG